MPKYQLDFKKPSSDAVAMESDDSGLQLSPGVLLRNAKWFIFLRWFVAATLFAYYLSGELFASKLASLHVQTVGWWALFASAVVLSSNLVFYRFIKSRLISPRRQLWVQIISDLLVLSFVIHFLGSIATPAPFLYIIHIALACVFFNARRSFRVVAFVSVLYLFVLHMEQQGIFPPRAILYSTVTARGSMSTVEIALHAAGVLSTLFVTWLILSRLSKAIRHHEDTIQQSRQRMIELQKEKDQFALHTTHQLKSPLSAIRSAISLLVGGYVGEVSDEVRKKLEIIERRASGMTTLIQDILSMYRLKTAPGGESERKLIRLDEVILAEIDAARSVAERRDIRFECDIEAAVVRMTTDHLDMLINNLITNAVVYSNDHSQIEVVCRSAPDGTSTFAVQDHGIGIPEEKIPKIFSEHYRTTEAVKHNPASTGIGLAMVKNIAEKYHISIDVDSTVGQGTLFTLHFPPQTENA